MSTDEGSDRRQIVVSPETHAAIAKPAGRSVAEVILDEVPGFNLAKAEAAGLLPNQVLRMLGREQRRRGQDPATRDALTSAAEAKRARRRARNLDRLA